MSKYNFKNLLFLTDDRPQGNRQEDGCLAQRKHQSPSHRNHHSGSRACHCCQGYVPGLLGFISNLSWFFFISSFEFVDPELFIHNNNNNNEL